MVVITTVLVSELKSLSSERGIIFKFYKYYWPSVMAIFGGASQDENVKVPHRMIGFTSLLGGLILWISYNASLASDLIVNERVYPFHDLESLSSTNWR